MESNFFNINLAVDYKIVYPEGTAPEDAELAKAQLSKNYIEYAVTAAYKAGLDSEQRKIYARAEKKIEEAIANKTYIAELNLVEHKIIADAFTSPDCKFAPGIAKYVTAFEEANFGSSNK